MKNEDIISRQAAIDMFNRLADDPWNANANTTWSKAYGYAAEMIEELPSAEPEQRWIPVTERLPEDGAEVWVTTEMLSEVTRARWHKDSNLWCHPYNSDCLLVLRPVAWMPFERPDPWKEEK